MPRRKMARLEDSLQLSTAVSFLAPVGFMGLRWGFGSHPFSLPLSSWFLVDALIQLALITLLRSGQLSRSRFSVMSYLAALTIGLPATVLAAYNGLAAEFRLIPLLYVLLQGRHRGRALYAFLLFGAGVLLLFPVFSGQLDFLMSELFRPVVLSLLLWISYSWRLSGRKSVKARLKRIKKTAQGDPRRELS